MRHNFDEEVNRVGSNCEKWDLEGEHGRLIPLSVADTDFKAPKEVVDAVKRKADFGVYAYGILPKERFVDSIVGWYKRRYQCQVDPETICYSQGIMPGALWMLLLALTKQEDEVLIQEPVYHNMRIITENMNRKVISNTLILKNGRYEIDWADFEAKVKRPECKVFLLCSPHNPVGRVFGKDELNRMCKLCIENNVFIICDEIHGDIVYEGNKHTPLFSLSDEVAQNCVVMNSPSKTFNVAGFFAAYVIIYNKEVREKYLEVYRRFHFDHNFIGVEALIAAYNECDYYADEQNQYFYKNIQLVTEFIKNVMPEVCVIHPEASYLMWLDFRAWNLAQEDLMELFKSWGVRMNDGNMYGESGIGFLRVNIATQEKTLKEALHRIEQGYKNWKAI